ncbi:MAG: RrF2 family transcriptional regulator [Jiangellaceae bacterium]
MRIQLGRKGDYAVRAVLDLARHESAGRRKTRSIAAEMSIPESYLPQILAMLVSSGMVTSAAGPDGGYALARRASDVSLLDVIEAVEGGVALNECVLKGGPCHWDTECAVHRFWSSAQDAFRDQLSAVSFADIAVVERTLGPAR